MNEAANAIHINLQEIKQNFDKLLSSIDENEARINDKTRLQQGVQQFELNLIRLVGPSPRLYLVHHRAHKMVPNRMDNRKNRRKMAGQKTGRNLRARYVGVRYVGARNFRYVGARNFRASNFHPKQMKMGEMVPQAQFRPQEEGETEFTISILMAYEYPKTLSQLLPNLLIAHVAGHMEYTDVRYFFKTNKRIYSAFKDTGKDKLCPYFLCFSIKDDVFSCEAFGDANASLEGKTVGKDYTFDKGRLGDNIAENIALIISQCSYVRSIEISEMAVTSDMVKRLIASKAKIDMISFVAAEIECSADEFVSVCQKCGMFRNKYSFFPGRFWTDKVFLKIIPYMAMCQFPDETSRRKRLTDVALMAVFEHCKNFKIPGVMTSFTVKGIIKGLQKYRGSGNYKHLFLDLGRLDSNQLDAANRFFNKDTGELKDLYKISVSGGKELDYELEFEDAGYQAFIFFSVLNPPH